jgi:hypothetical protein
MPLCNMGKLFLCAYLSILSASATYGSSDSVTWSSYRLQPSDFRGRYDTAVFGRNHFALTVWKLTYYHRWVARTGQAEVLVYAWFDCRRSWLRPAEKQNTRLLLHEQVHFDLAEVLARRFRKRLAENQFTRQAYAKTVENFFSALLSETYALQQDYDEDTQFGNNASEQARWQKRVQAELQSLEAFSTHQVFTLPNP